MNKFKDLYGDTLSLLSKDDLISIIEQYYNCCFKIGEELVSESKLHVTSREALLNIINYLNDVNFKFYDEDVLRKQIKNNMGV